MGTVQSASSPAVKWAQSSLHPSVVTYDLRSPPGEVQRALMLAPEGLEISLSSR